MYCIDGHERKPKGLILTRLKDIELASIIEQQYEKIFLYVETCMNDLSSAGVTLKFCCPRNLIKLGSEKFPCRSHGVTEPGTERESRILFQNISISISFGPTSKQKHIYLSNLSQKMPENLLNLISISSKYSFDRFCMSSYHVYQVMVISEVCHGRDIYLSCAPAPRLV